jgi:hypothetical protein
MWARVLLLFVICLSNITQLFSPVFSQEFFSEMKEKEELFDL